ncbi:MAG: MOSC domain-containing protein [Dehalococcoidia bacterium]
MPTVDACYLYPVKGMTPLEAPFLELEPGRSPKGDRAFVFAFANAEKRGAVQWVSKHESVTLLNTPYLARLRAAYDVDTQRLSISSDEHGTASANVANAEERIALAAWLAEVVEQLPANPLAGRPERKPLELLGDGRSLFTDRGPTQVSFAAAESLRVLSQRAGNDIDMRRFRLNLSISGVTPWEEFEWAGKQVRFGETLLDVSAPLIRCVAVNASPEGDGRDLDVVAVLQRAFGHLNFGVEANVIEGGRVKPGDLITVMG